MCHSILPLFIVTLLVTLLVTNRVQTAIFRAIDTEINELCFISQDLFI